MARAARSRVSRSALKSSDAAMIGKSRASTQPSAIVAVRAVDLDVVLVPALELLHRLFDDLDAVVLAHRLRGEVRVRAGAVPVALDRLRVERGADAEVLADAVEEPARQPELVGDVGRADGADLELPLSGHDLGVRADDVDPGAHARLGMRLDDLAPEDLVAADAAVVAALRRGEAVVGPAERPVALEEGVLLLDAEPGVVLFVLFDDLAQPRSRVRPVHAAVRVQHFAEDEEVALAVQRVRDVLDRTEEKVAEMTARLHRAGAVVAPLGDVVEMLDRVDDLRLRAELGRRPLAVNPYIFCGDF